MDTRWLSSIKPRYLAKAVREIADAQIRTDRQIQASLEDQVLEAFQAHELPPAGFISGFRARHAAATVLRSLPKLSQANDARAAQWLEALNFDNQDAVLFNLLFTQAYNRYIQETPSTSVGPLAAARVAVIAAVVLPRSKTIAPEIVTCLLSGENSYTDLCQLLARRPLELEALPAVAPFDEGGGPFLGLIILFILNKFPHQTRSFLFGTARDAVEKLLGQRSQGFVTRSPLRIFSEIVNLALESYVRNDAVWTDNGVLLRPLRLLIERRLLDPDENPARWRFVQPELVAAYKVMLRREAVNTFFDANTDDDRREFWRDYASAMETVPTTMGDAGQVFLMIFGKIGIIETKEAGKGAAYVYTRADIERVFLKPENQEREHSFYKTQAPCETVARLNHYMGWQPRFSAYLRRSHGIVPDRER